MTWAGTVEHASQRFRPHDVQCLCNDQGLSYVPDFVRREDETALIAAIDHAAEGRWIDSSSGRRIANFGGRPGTLNVVEVCTSPVTPSSYHLVVNCWCMLNSRHLHRISCTA